jgi:16S rRNA (uracil1498-N3)-methyltransferase
MQRHRFFAPPSQIIGENIFLEAEESQHLARVLRLLSGAIVFAFDGEGTEYECEIAVVHKAHTQLKIRSRLGNEVESPLHLTLGQALVKSDKFDWVVQKATELGVTQIVPLITEHSEFRKAENLDGRLQRWRRIALEATKQCGRRKIPVITEAQKFAEFCDAQSNVKAKRFILSERDGKSFGEKLSANSVIIAIGPEGGWHESELTYAQTHNFTSIHLGERILRTETAAITAVSIAQFLLGDLS